MPLFSTRPRFIDCIGWALLALALIFAVYTRWRLREFPLERDEGEFAYAGQLILEGVPPYKLAYNMKLPGTYLAYAALMACFGQTTPGVHLGLLAVNMATIVLLYRFARELFDPFTAGIAAAAYAILSESPAMLGMAAHATHFVAFFGLAGEYLLWRHLQSGRLWQAVASGLLMGIAFLMKQQGVFLMVFGGGMLLLHGLLSRTYPRRRLLASVPLYSFAAVLPYALTCLWMWRAGVWEKFWYWTVKYGSTYVQGVPLSEAPASFWMNFQGVVQLEWPLCLLALAGVAGVAILGRGKPGLRTFVLAFFVFSFLCSCPGFYFRSHYFIVMLPAMALLAGQGSRLLWDLTTGGLWSAAPSDAAGSEQKPPKSRQKRADSRRSRPETPPTPAASFGPFSAIVLLLLLGAFAKTLLAQSDFFYSMAPLDACQRIYMSNPFVEAPVVAQYLRDRTDPDDTIAVLGSEPEIFFDAHRRSATGYIYTYGLVEEQPLALEMQKQMIAEIEAAKPKYIVFTNVRCSWLTRPKSETEILKWSNDYLAQHYQPVGFVEPIPFVDRIKSEFYWDDDTRKYSMRNKPTDKPTMLDVQWKISAFQNSPATYNYWRLPFLTVLKRKN